MRAISMTWRLVLVLLASGCLLAPASADARWRTGDEGFGAWTDIEVCRDGAKVAYKTPNTSLTTVHIQARSRADEAVVYSQVLPLPLSHGVRYGEFTIRFSRLLDPNLPYNDDQVSILFTADGSNGWEYNVNDCYLATATNGRIAFSSRPGSNDDIYTINADDATLQQIEDSGGTPARQQLTTNPAQDIQPAWSPDGTKIAFASNRDGDYEIYVMNAVPEGPSNPAIKLAANVPGGFSSGEDVSPTWSPDGTEIAFSSDRDSDFVGFHGYSIYKVNSDGSGSATGLTWPEGQNAVEPEWGPDGRILFRDDRTTGDIIYKLTPNEASLVAVGDAPGDASEPYWTPDGTYLAINNPGSTAIWVVCADPPQHAGDAHCDDEYMGPDGPSASATNPRSGAWAPDGLKIAYENNQGDSEIWANSPGKASIGYTWPLQLTNNTYADSDPDWQPVYPGYPRAKGATPVRVSLVPAYAPCTLAIDNRVHGPPDFPGNSANPDASCNPPTQISSHVTVGSPDAHPGTAANSVGYVQFQVISGNPSAPPDEADVALTANITDVRKKSDLSDYTGQLQLQYTVQITDKFNGPPEPMLNAPAHNIAGTVEGFVDAPTVACTATSDPNVGSTCSIATTLDALAPGSIQEGKRTTWEIGTVFVKDGGADGLVSTLPNATFAKQGVFVP